METRNIRIYVDTTGEQWGIEGDIRPANENDVNEWGEEYGIQLGDIISAYGLGDFEVGEDLAYMHVSEEELDELDILTPRKLVDFYERARGVIDDVVTIQRAWRSRLCRFKCRRDVGEMSARCRRDCTG